MHRLLPCAVAGVMLGQMLAALQADESAPQTPPLHARIDALLAEQSPLQPIPLAGDAEFLRRASLDIVGVPPTEDEVRRFLEDQDPHKRATLLDRLFADPRFERHLVEVLDVMLMERRANTHVPQDEWLAYLLQSVREDKPWNQLAREILAADGVNGPRAAARFYLDRGCEPNLLTRDAGRIFFGRDLQCAQCHDHPLINDYRMADYHGLLAIFSTGYEVKIPKGDKEIACYAERSATDLEFESVFIKGTRHLTAARLPGGPEWEEPVFLPGEDYTVPPADKTLSVPKFSRRQRLAELATSGESRAFNENIANRLWGLMMGRCLVHPADLLHSENPAPYPALLPLLGAEFAASGYAIRPFLKELALTQVYQRAWEPPADVLPASARAGEVVANLEAEAAALESAATQASTALAEALEKYEAAETALLPAVDELSAARKKYGEQLKQVAAADKAVAEAQQKLTEKQGVATPVAEAATKAQEAAAKLAGDQELAAAAAKFVERAGQLQTEVAALQKVLEEKQAAQRTVVEARQAVRAEVEAAQQKVDPLRQALRTQDQLVLAARQQAVETATARNQHRARLDMLRLLAGVKPLSEQIAAQAERIAASEQAVAAAQAAVTEYGATVTAAQERLTAATSTQTAAADALAKVQAEHQRQTEVVGAVATALKSTEAARQQLPDDPLLAEAAAKLKQRVDELTVALNTHQQAVDAATQQLNGAQQQVTTANQELAAAQTELARRQQNQATAAGELAAAQQLAEQQQTQFRESLATLQDRWSQQATLSDLRPLTPEQLCWSIFQVTGVYDRYRQTELAELDKTSPLSEEAKQDPAQVLAREREIEQRTFDKLKGNLGTFVSLYGAGAGQPQGDFFATADQALFAANGGSILGWVAPASGNVTERIIQATEPQRAAEHLYLGVLARLPTSEEVAAVAAYLAARPEQRPAAAQELVWGLITSSEFRFNY